jgi:nucleotide-binding universal stress UspA family protein
MIPQIKTILFATDLSKNAAYAFYFAVQIAKRVEAKIVILHAVEPLPPMVVSFGDFSHQVARDRWDETAKKFIAVTSREGTGARFVVRIPPLPSQQDKMD